jgi:hypothetical protein
MTLGLACTVQQCLFYFAKLQTQYLVLVRFLQDEDWLRLLSGRFQSTLAIIFLNRTFFWMCQHKVFFCSSLTINTDEKQVHLEIKKRV